MPAISPDLALKFLNRLDSLGNRLDSIEDERGREEMRIDQIDKELAEVWNTLRQ